MGTRLTDRQNSGSRQEAGRFFRWERLRFYYPRALRVRFHVQRRGPAPFPTALPSFHDTFTPLRPPPPPPPPLPPPARLKTPPRSRVTVR